jgi:hypothetical protein
MVLPICGQGLIQLRRPIASISMLEKPLFWIYPVHQVSCTVLILRLITSYISQRISLSYENDVALRVHKSPSSSNSDSQNHFRFQETDPFAIQRDGCRLTLLLKAFCLIMNRTIRMDCSPDLETESIFDTNVLRRNYAIALLRVSFGMQIVNTVAQQPDTSGCAIDSGDTVGYWLHERKECVPCITTRNTSAFPRNV